MIFPLLQRLIKPAAGTLSDIATRFHLHNGVFFPYTVKTLKSHSLGKSDTFQYGLEIEKIDFSETLPIFNLY